MPGPFTHIYTQRRVADLLQHGVTDSFVRPDDDPLPEGRALDPDGLLLDPLTLQQAMADWPKFAALGAIGPDLCFFLQDYADPRIPCDEIMLALSLLYFLDDQNRIDEEHPLADTDQALLAILAEVNETFADILRFILKIDHAWQAFVKVWDATIGPILDAAGKVLDDVTGGLLSELGDAFTELATALVAVGAEELLTEGDIFGWFALKMRKGYDEQAFLWSDMLHYRRTSRVPQRLFAHARDLIASSDATDNEHGNQLLAYASGWVCHVGTDTVAHSFVNEQAGGPFRTHWQRHHVVENHLDAFNYQCTGDGTLTKDEFVGFMPTYDSLAKSALYFAVQIPQGIDGLDQAKRLGDLRKPLPTGDSRADKAKRKELLDTDGELPDWLAETLVRVLVEVYADPADGGIAALQEEQTPHPRNLGGQAFQDALGDGTSELGRWLQAFGVNNAGMALPDLRRLVAPDTPAGLNVPEGFPLPWELKATYRFMLSWFKRSFFSQFDMDRPKRPAVFQVPSSDFDFGPPDFSGVSSSDPPLEQACEVVLALLDWVFKTAKQAAQLLEDLGKAAASGVTMPARDWLFDHIVLPAWTVCENVRIVLVHLGYLMPQSEQRWDDGELRKPNEIDHELITLGHTVDGAFAAALGAAFDVLGNLDHDAAVTVDTMRNPKSADYPFLPIKGTPADVPAWQAWIAQHTPIDLGVHDVAHWSVEFRRPWAYPDRNNDPDPANAGNYVETPETTAGPYPFGTMPPTLVQLTGPASNQLRLGYERAGCPGDTDALNSEFVGHEPFTEGFPAPEDVRRSGTSPLGDPAVFSAYLIGQIANNQGYDANFNLDADRGYGYLCWDWTRGDAQDRNPRGQTYPAPVVWPEGADDARWQPPAPTAADQHPAPRYAPPLQLRYPGRVCHEEAPTHRSKRTKGGPR